MSLKVNYPLIVKIAYLFFGGIALAWFCTTWMVGHKFNPTALVLTIVYATLLWFNNRIANLVAGIASLFFSFFMLMDVMNTFDLLSKNRDYGMAAKVLLAMSVAGIVLSVFLAFSFTKGLENNS